MALTYGFYDSVGQDRLYNAKQFSEIFNGIINDGIFESIGDNFVVTKNVSLGGLNILVGTGRAWFDSTWTNNDAAYPLYLETASAIYARIDYVVLEVNTGVGWRINSLKVIKGTPASVPVAPALTNTATVHQYPLASIRISANQTIITGLEITNMVGSSPTPFITGILETVDTTAMIAQWQAQFSDWYDSLVDQLDDVDAAYLLGQVNNINTELGNLDGRLDTIEANPALDNEYGVTLFIDNGDEVITIGNKITTECPFNGSLLSWTITSGDLTVGSISLILERISYANFSGGSWTSLGTVAMSSTNKATGTFTSKTIVKGEIMRIRITATPTSVKKIALSLKGLKT